MLAEASPKVVVDTLQTQLDQQPAGVHICLERHAGEPNAPVLRLSHEPRAAADTPSAPHQGGGLTESQVHKGRSHMSLSGCMRSTQSLWLEERGALLNNQHR